MKAGLSLLEKWITDVTEEVSINFCVQGKIFHGDGASCLIFFKGISFLINIVLLGFFSVFLNKYVIFSVCRNIMA